MCPKHEEQYCTHQLTCLLHALEIVVLRKKLKKEQNNVQTWYHLGFILVCWSLLSEQHILKC